MHEKSTECISWKCLSGGDCYGNKLGYADLSIFLFHCCYVIVDESCEKREHRLSQQPVLIQLTHQNIGTAGGVWGGGGKRERDREEREEKGDLPMFPS